MSVLNIRLSDLIRPELVMDLEAPGKREAIETLCTRMAADSRVSDGAALRTAIFRREAQVSTGVGQGIAIPHVKIPEVSDYIVTIGRSRAGVEFEAIDRKPVNLIFMIAAADHQTKEFVRILAKVTHLLKDYDTRQALIEAAIPDDFIRVIIANER